MTMEILSMPGFGMNASSRSMSSIDGILLVSSAVRIMILSSQSGPMPLRQPYAIPIVDEMIMLKTPIDRETRPPYQRIEYMSRPIESVPK